MAIDQLLHPRRPIQGVLLEFRNYRGPLWRTWWSSIRQFVVLLIAFFHQGRDRLAQRLIGVIDEELLRLGVGRSRRRCRLGATDSRDGRQHKGNDSQQNRQNYPTC